MQNTFMNNNTPYYGFTPSSTSTPPQQQTTSSSSFIGVGGMTVAADTTSKTSVLVWIIVGLVVLSAIGVVAYVFFFAKKTASVPDAPTNVVATAGNAQATITFLSPANNGGSSPITKYVATSFPGSLTGTSTSNTITITGLTNDVAYVFFVNAVNATGTSVSSTASNSVTPKSGNTSFTVPGAPTNVTAAVTGASQATITFQAPSSNGGSIITLYTATSNPGGLTGTTTNASTGIIISGLTNSISYTFTVKATNSIGNSVASSPSNAVILLLSTVPGPPTNVIATATKDTITLSFNIPSSDGGVIITKYRATSYPHSMIAESIGNIASIVYNNTLVVGTSYTFTIVAMNGIGISTSSAPSTSVIAVSAPGKPTNVTATNNTGNASASVLFIAPTSNGGNTITAYKILAFFAANNTQIPGTPPTGSSSPIIVPNLTNGTTYYFKVVAMNQYGDSLPSDPSMSLMISSPPSKPTNVSLVPLNNALQVTFIPGSTNGSSVTGFLVTATKQIDGTVSTVTGTSSPITISGLINDQAYNITVTTLSSSNEGNSLPSDAVVGTPVVPQGTFPSAPTNVVVTPGNAQATITFVPPASDSGSSIMKYTFKARNITTNVITTQDDATAPFTPQIVTGLTNGVTYAFSLSATNAVGEGANSSPEVQTTPTAGVPDPPTALTTIPGLKQVTLNWSSPINNGGSSITSYNIIISPAPTTGIATQTTTGVATSHIVTDLIAGTIYSFTVTAVNSVGESVTSNAKTETPYDRPGAPTNVSASIDTSSSTSSNMQATVTWSASVANGSVITNYKVISSSPDSITTPIQDAGTATSKLFTGLTNGISYTFTVIATNAAGDSNSSTPTPTAVIPYTVPEAPMNVIATADDQSATVTWTSVPTSNNGGKPIDTYNIFDADDVLKTTVSGTDSNTATITGLTNGTYYSFKVKAHNAAGDSPASAISNTVVPIGNPSPPSNVIVNNTTLANNNNNIIYAGDGQAELSWTSSNNGNGAAIMDYIIVSDPITTTQNTGSSATTKTFTGLTNGNAYTFTVTTKNAANKISAGVASLQVVPMGTPTAPTAVTATASTDGSGNITISWTASSNTGGSDILSYMITSNPAPVTAPATTTVNSTTTTTTTMSGFTFNTAYTFTVTATNMANKTSVASIASTSVTPTAQPPGKPENLNATYGVPAAKATGTSSIVLTWTAPTTTGGSAAVITNYVIHSQTPGSNLFEQIGNVLTFTKTELNANTEYTITIRAQNNGNVFGINATIAPILNHNVSNIDANTLSVRTLPILSSVPIQLSWTKAIKHSDANWDPIAATLPINASATSDLYITYTTPLPSNSGVQWGFEAKITSTGSTYTGKMYFCDPAYSDYVNYPTSRWRDPYADALKRGTVGNLVLIQFDNGNTPPNYHLSQYMAWYYETGIDSSKQQSISWDYTYGSNFHKTILADSSNQSLNPP